MRADFKLEAWIDFERRTWKYLMAYTPGDIDWRGADWMSDTCIDEREFFYEDGIFNHKFMTTQTLTLCFSERDFMFMPYKEDQYFETYKIRWCRLADNEGDGEGKAVVFHHARIIRIDPHRSKINSASYYNVYMRVTAGVEYPGVN